MEMQVHFLYVATVETRSHSIAHCGAGFFARRLLWTEYGHHQQHSLLLYNKRDTIAPYTCECVCVCVC